MIFKRRYFIILFIFLLGCKQKIKKDFFSVTNAKGIKETGYLMNDSTLVDSHKYYYPNGKLKCEEFYVNGKREGQRTNFYSNGNIQQKCFYNSGLLDGWCINYNQDGTLDYKVFYLQGKQVGDNYSYYPSGSVKHYVLLNFSHELERYISYKPDGTFVDSVGGSVFADTLYNNQPDSKKTDSIYIGLLLSHPPYCKTSIKILEEDKSGKTLAVNPLDSSKSYIYFTKLIDPRVGKMRVVANQYDSTVKHERVYSTIILF
jgi:hypothetical protein